MTYEQLVEQHIRLYGETLKLREQVAALEARDHRTTNAIEEVIAHANRCVAKLGVPDHRCVWFNNELQALRLELRDESEINEGE